MPESPLGIFFAGVFVGFIIRKAIAVVGGFSRKVRPGYDIEDVIRQHKKRREEEKK